MAMLGLRLDSVLPDRGGWPHGPRPLVFMTARLLVHFRVCSRLVVCKLVREVLIMIIRGCTLASDEDCSCGVDTGGPSDSG